ncbi:hypothetical protein EJB05_08523, partial [Eragrostis curvula]
LFLAVVASVLTDASSQDNPFTWVDCQTRTPLGRGAHGVVRGICRGDVAPADCATYLRSAAARIVSNCTNDTSSRRAAIWYDKCFLSYGDTNASTGHEDTFLYNSGQVGDKDAFEKTYYALMSRLAARVVARTPMFATGEAVYDRDAANGTMYGLVQCTRDRTAAECNRCLQRPRWRSCRAAAMGTRAGWCSATTATCVWRFTPTMISRSMHRRRWRQLRRALPETSTALQSSPFERLVAVGAILYSPTPFEYVPHLPCRRCSKPSSPARPSEALLGVLAQK